MGCVYGGGDRSSTHTKSRDQNGTDECINGQQHCIDTAGARSKTHVLPTAKINARCQRTAKRRDNIYISEIRRTLLTCARLLPASRVAAAPM